MMKIYKSINRVGLSAHERIALDDDVQRKGYFTEQ